MPLQEKLPVGVLLQSEGLPVPLAWSQHCEVSPEADCSPTFHLLVKAVLPKHPDGRRETWN